MVPEHVEWEPWVDKTNPVDLLHELLAELLGAERDEIADIGPEESLSDYGMDSLRLIALVQRLGRAGFRVDYATMARDQRLGSWETLVSRGPEAHAVDTIRAGEVEADAGFTTGYRERDWEPLTTPRPGFVPMPEDRAARYRSDGLWRGRTFDGMLALSVDAHPAKIAITDGHTSISYAQLWRQIDAAAKNFAARGVRPGEHVICYLPNIIEFYPIYLGLVRLGAIPLLALPGHREVELAAFARSIEPRAIVTVERWLGTDHGDIARDVAAGLSGDMEVAVWTDPEVLVTDDPTVEVDRSSWGTHPEDAAFLLVSGGSTGVPKLIARFMDGYGLTLELSNRICAIDEETVYLAALPVAHNYANSSPGALGVLMAGGTVVLAASPSPDICLPLIDRHRVDVVALVPPIAMLWVDHLGGAEAPGSLRTVLIGGAKLTVSAAERVENAFPGCLQQVFGMAEGLVCYTDLDDTREIRLTTQGHPMSEADELLVLDPEGEPVARGEIGELRTRGPYTISGYYRNPQATAKAVDANGYYRTGDLVRVTDEGDVIVEGRAVQTINRAGEKILGEEVEDVLLRLDGIINAAVTGQPDDLMGQRIVAFLTIRDGSELNIEAIRRHLRDSGLASFKHPDRIEIVTELPVTAVGKNDRGKLLRGDER